MKIAINEKKDKWEFDAFSYTNLLLASVFNQFDFTIKWIPFCLLSKLYMYTNRFEYKRELKSRDCDALKIHCSNLEDWMNHVDSNEQREKIQIISHPICFGVHFSIQSYDTDLRSNFQLRHDDVELTDYYF